MKLNNSFTRILIFSLLIFFIIGFTRNSENENNSYTKLNETYNERHPVADMISEKKESGALFESYSIFSINSGQAPASLSGFVKTATILKLNILSLLNINSIKSGNLNFIIPLTNNKNLELELTQVNILSEDYAKKNSFKPGLYYQGIIKGDPKSIASINIFDNWVEGIISNKDGNYVLGPIKDQNKNSSNYILYNDADLLVKSNFHCMTDDHKNDKGSFKNHIINPNPNLNINTTHPVKVFFVADYQMYLDNNSDTNAVKQFITAIFANSQLIYSNEANPIPRVISDIYVYTTPDPYVNFSTTESIPYLVAFGANTQDNFNGDLAQLLSTGHGGQLGGIAWINVLCASYNPADSSGRFSFCNIENTYQLYPTYSWTVEVITHEMGHNLASKHTQACVWPIFSNGGIGAIDSCYYSEGGCFTNAEIHPIDNGTIMSYCHLQGHINFSLGFGPLPSDTIYYGYQLASCIDSMRNISDYPATYSLLQNYPNPFNPSTTIKFALPKEGFVTISVYDITGREVAKLINNKYYNYGIYSISMDGNLYKMASGVYLYRVTVNNSNKQTYSDIKKMVYIK